MLLERMVPTGNSMAWLLIQYMAVRRNGLTEKTVFITLLFLSMNITSMAKRIKNVCMELQGFKTTASPLSSPLRPRSPFALEKTLFAITALSAIVELFVELIIFIDKFIGD